MSIVDESGASLPSDGEGSMELEHEEGGSRGKGPKSQAHSGAKSAKGRGRPPKAQKEGEKGGKKKRRVESYNVYINKTLKGMAEGQMGAKKGAIEAMSALVYDMLDRLGAEAAVLCKLRGSKQLNVSDIEAATRLIFPGELSTHAVQAMRESHAKVKSYDN